MPINPYYSEEIHGPHQIFKLGNFELESGITLPDAKLAFKSFGKLNATRNNAILFPHIWSGTPKALEMFINENRPLDPSKYFIILPGQFANGFSSSPNNTPPPFNDGAFPAVTFGDDVRAQHRLLTKLYGITEARNLHAYQKTGVFPEGTVIVKELTLVLNPTFPDGSRTELSGRGFFNGRFNGIDVTVKDSKRLAKTNGWGFFTFGHHAQPYAQTASESPATECAGCHPANVAKTDMTWVRFYPLLREKHN